jgi:hypothetical protein
MARDAKSTPTCRLTAKVLTVLYLMSVTIQKLPAHPDQTAAGEKAARQLQEFVPTFTAANKPAAPLTPRGPRVAPRWKRVAKTH